MLVMRYKKYYLAFLINRMSLEDYNPGRNCSLYADLKLLRNELRQL
ncbi:hypothetical protein AciX8_1923 [Granulicella mallensis MP5ACTX8]|uniref:Uncharacterized protein n=1 Tax=Granulicella mallensis (strain ATCC BAA-1857 / DSM 23137 / MP5ACTX8) TaxID=682795 RepID=G8NS49_GRAMM|nr:hypothetical protein AciX8_1923 [Granulicella mallensis MP5ACTX8]